MCVVRLWHCYCWSSTTKSRSVDEDAPLRVCLWWLCDSCWMEASAESQKWAGKHQPCPLSNPTTPCSPLPTCRLHHNCCRTQKSALLKFVSRTSRGSSVLKWTGVEKFTIWCRQVYFCSHDEDLPEYLSSRFLSLLRVKLALPHKFHSGPQGNYHNKSFCAHSLVWATAMVGIPDFPLFYVIYPSRLLQTRGLHPPLSLLASTPQPTKGETEEESRAEGAYFQSLTVNKQGYSCCLLLPHRRFLFWRGEVFMNFPFCRALNLNITHTCEPMSQVGDESHWAMTLSFIIDTFGTVFFFLVET